jgi:hypothetical protein
VGQITVRQLTTTQFTARQIIKGQVIAGQITKGQFIARQLISLIWNIHWKKNRQKALQIQNGSKPSETDHCDNVNLPRGFYFENARLFFKNALNFKDIFSDVEAFLEILIIFKDISREIRAFFN